jgi:hypothetical protein
MVVSGFAAFLGHEASSHGECIICLEPKSLTLAVLCDDEEQRVCRHYLCIGCANQLLRHVCPCCRAEYVRAVQLPSPHRNPRQLFNLIDVSGDGKLSKAELAEYCAAFVGVDTSTIAVDIDERWSVWDEDSDGLISYFEFVSGVCPMLEMLYAREKRAARSAEQVSPFNIHIKRLSSVRQEVFTHRHDRHQTSVSKAVARVIEVRWLMKKS